MARILVAAATAIPAQAAARALIEQARADGHDAAPCEGALDIKDADALIALMDGADGATHAAAAAAVALDKPLMALVAPGNDAPVRGPNTLVREGADIDEWLGALDDFYERVNPFAGRLVRDLIPQLVKEAGHDVRFRAVSDEDKPRFLKQKIQSEAAELLAAGPGAEKEEIADLLEALEALIRARGYDREALKQVKAAKNKRRGGFERGWVVEETAHDPEPTPQPDPPEEPTRPGPPPGAQVFEV